jgi:methionyl-tRNA formyltransferase
MKITILTDNPNSWIIPYVDTIKNKLNNNHNVEHVLSYKDIKKGDILFILSCEKIIKKEVLELNKNNIVVHPSKLPKGRGWSPLAWQIIEGNNEIPISLFEAVEDVDAGPVYILDYIKLEGHELNDEIKDEQGKKTIEMVNRYVDNYPMEPKQQNGVETFYQKRKEKDNELDINKTIDEQFNLFRIVDNERYPIHFIKNGIKYKLKIYK